MTISIIILVVGIIVSFYVLREDGGVAAVLGILMCSSIPLFSVLIWGLIADGVNEAADFVTGKHTAPFEEADYALDPEIISSIKESSPNLISPRSGLIELIQNTDEKIAKLNLAASKIKGEGNAQTIKEKVESLYLVKSKLINNLGSYNSQLESLYASTVASQFDTTSDDAVQATERAERLKSEIEAIKNDLYDL